MKVLVISDTHGNIDRLQAILNTTGPYDAVFHCGDIEGQEHTIQEYADCPTYMVSGNNDWDSSLPADLNVTIDDYRFWVCHGHRYGVSLSPSAIREEAESRNVDVCLFGHTHKPYLETSRGLTLMNPGSLSYPRQIGRKPTFGVIEIDRHHDIHFAIKELED
ncbi:MULTISPECIES: metallophosphoesterase family protein [unclassified Bilifractor]|uniref:metallophosphoesterase family protein n=1 Tax=unclassified Bilifractor TaxID=2815795 RepID=UPI003F9280F9